MHATVDCLHMTIHEHSECESLMSGVRQKRFVRSSCFANHVFGSKVVVEGNPFAHVRRNFSGFKSKRVIAMPSSSASFVSIFKIFLMMMRNMDAQDRNAILHVIS